jgi:hypothetical protein
MPAVGTSFIKLPTLKLVILRIKTNGQKLVMHVGRYFFFLHAVRLKLKIFTFTTVLAPYFKKIPKVMCVHENLCIYSIKFCTNWTSFCETLYATGGYPT